MKADQKITTPWWRGRPQQIEGAAASPGIHFCISVLTGLLRQTKPLIARGAILHGSSLPIRCGVWWMSDARAEVSNTGLIGRV